MTRHTTYLRLRGEGGLPVDCDMFQIILLIFNFCLDEKNLNDYGVKDGTKLILAVRRSDDGGPDANILRSATYTFLRRFYSEPEARKIQEEFIKVRSFKLSP